MVKGLGFGNGDPLLTGAGPSSSNTNANALYSLTVLVSQKGLLEALLTDRNSILSKVPGSCSK
jgi:hypothetical protein